MPINRNKQGPDFDISYLRRRGEYNFSSRLATRDAIPADEKTSFSNNLASSCRAERLVNVCKPPKPRCTAKK
ncbi:hypothetical protein ALC60_02863 [Trachymyrmex zeteki]|uniref:Uncharacterized protein n=1 Tax=Mycetomoellerius zeteki TaxID=64791 RepID=A0A151XCM6_9HYME|nr:hypothetical protein ALC60_02863 [Trachymyrmex zeteki]